MRPAQLEKQGFVEELKQQFVESSASYVVNYQGCSCAELGDLRKKLRPSGAKLAVIKNTLARRAVESTDVEGLKDCFVGPTAVVWSKDGLVAPAKVLKEFAKEQEAFQIKGGFADGQVLDTAGVDSIASMPSKEELLGKLLALLNAPATRLLQTINAPGTNLVRLLGAVKAKKEESGE